MDKLPVQNRRLAAVMFLDMVGFSAMMARNESMALGHVRHLEKILRAEVPSHGGRLVKFLGDGTMAEFPTAVSAVLCAKAILARIEDVESKQAAPDLKVRIGLHLGELVEHDGDIFGDAVNIAARVQPLAEPNGVAMSESVYAQIKNQMSLQGGFLPPQKLKNIPGRQRIYVLLPPDSSVHLWSVRRRAIPALAAALAAAAIAAGGFWVSRRDRPVPLRFACVLITSKANDPQAARMTRSIEEEFEIHGPRIEGARWVDRDGVLEAFQKKGLKDLSLLATGEAGSCQVARDIGLRFPLWGRLETLGTGQWRLETRATDTEDLSVVGAWTADGRAPAELVKATVGQIQAWLDAHGEEYE
jgi:class 3 adenylate cyclase